MLPYRVNGRTAGSHWQRGDCSKPLHLRSSSLVTIHLCWFWTTQTLEEEKHNSLPLARTCSLCLSVCASLSCTLPHTYRFAQMKNVKGRPPGCSMPAQRKNLPVLINEAQCAEHALSHSHITAIRQACAWLAAGHCLLLRSLKVSFRVIDTNPTNFTGAKMCNKGNLKHYCAVQMILGWIR